MGVAIPNLGEGEAVGGRDGSVWKSAGEFLYVYGMMLACCMLRR